MTRARLLVTVAAAGMGWARAARAEQAGLAGTPIVSVTTAPAGTEALAVEWMKVETPGLGILLAAVARPAGKGPFPAVILLHGSHGFAREYVQLAQDLARGGVLAIAPCWFSGGGGAGAVGVSPPIACPEAPSPPLASGPQALQAVAALVRAARSVPGVRADRVALFGHSRGGGAALSYAAEKADVQALILDSSGYADPVADLAARVRAPVLVLHGTADGPADGGSAFTSVERARSFEAALRRAGKPVEAKYYEGGQHGGIFTSATQHLDEVQRMVAFLKARLR